MNIVRNQGIAYNYGGRERGEEGGEGGVGRGRVREREREREGEEQQSTFHSIHQAYQTKYVLLQWCTSGTKEILSRWL